mgnify:CR=1 FL=1
MINPFSTWIKLPRDFVNWQWYTNTNMVHTYLNLLLNANLVDSSKNGVLVRRGEYMITLSIQEEDTGLSIHCIRTCLAILEKTHEIKFKKIKKGRIIVISNFNKYQPLGIDEVNPTWVKLYRKLCEWNSYKNPHMVHLIVHFMLKGEPVIQSDGKVLWQLTTSYRTLKKETGMSIQILRTCIKKLTNMKEIAVLVFPTHQFSIVTLCNYNSYEVEKIEGGTMLAQSRHDVGTKIDYVEDDEKSTQVTHLETDIDICKNNSYEVEKIEGGTMLAQSRHDVGTPLAQQMTSKWAQSGHDGGTNVASLKEYKKERIKESSSSSFHAQERENFENRGSSRDLTKENEQKKVEKESFYEELKGNSVWLKAMTMKFHFSDTKQVIDKLDEFQLDLICRGRDEHSSLQDCMNHFNDWLMINIKRSKIADSVPSARQKERWTGEYYVPKSSEGGIYDGKF